MYLEKRIVKHLVQKYKPKAIFLTGSRAKGYSTETSDWDMVLLTKNKVDYIGENFADQELDMHLKRANDIKENILGNRWSPYQKIKVIYDISDGLAEKIVSATAKAYKAGPAKLNPVEYETQKRFDKRKIIKLESSIHNQPVFFHFLSIYFQEVIAHWFLLKRIWPIDVKPGMKYFEKKDKKFYNLLALLVDKKSNREKIKIAKQIYNYLYKEKI